MPYHTEQRLMSYTQEQLFSLVADVAQYPAFLPWCLAARIKPSGEKKSRDTFVADLVIGFKGLRETFTSIVTTESPKTIRVTYGGGALSHLSNEWLFEKGTSKKTCLVTFTVDFQLKSALLDGLMQLFFEHALRKMVSAFEKRAQELYGS